jgi:hypothetical protein
MKRQVEYGYTPKSTLTFAPAVECDLVYVLDYINLTKNIEISVCIDGWWFVNRDHSLSAGIIGLFSNAGTVKWRNKSYFMRDLSHLNLILESLLEHVSNKSR